MPTYLNYSRGAKAKEVSASRLKKLEKESLQTLERLLKVSENNLIAFSGGKDSLIVAHLASTHFGVKDAVIETSFMFTKSLQEARAIADHAGLELTERTRLTWDWLKRNQEYCAPPMKMQSKLYAIRQQMSVKSYAKDEGYTGVIYGRRIQENTVKSDLYQLKDGQHQCHPIRDWLTDDVWAYIERKGLPYPSLYNHEIGIKEGFTPFLLPPEHFNGNVWKAIYDYEPEVVFKFAEFHEPAKQFLANENISR